MLRGLDWLGHYTDDHRMSHRRQSPVPKGVCLQRNEELALAVSWSAENSPQVLDDDIRMCMSSVLLLTPVNGGRLNKTRDAPQQEREKSSRSERSSLSSDGYTLKKLQTAMLASSASSSFITTELSSRHGCMCK